MILPDFRDFDLKRLPDVRGTYKKHVVMAPYTWFRVGGAAATVFRPQDHEDLSQFLLQNSEEVPVTIIGAASNILIRDGGIPGVVIKLGKILPLLISKVTACELVLACQIVSQLV